MSDPQELYIQFTHTKTHAHEHAHTLMQTHTHTNTHPHKHAHIQPNTYPCKRSHTHASTHPQIHTQQVILLYTGQLNILNRVLWVYTNRAQIKSYIPRTPHLKENCFHKHYGQNHNGTLTTFTHARTNNAGAGSSIEESRRNSQDSVQHRICWLSKPGEARLKPQTTISSVRRSSFSVFISP